MSIKRIAHELIPGNLDLMETVEVYAVTGGLSVYIRQGDQRVAIAPDLIDDLIQSLQDLQMVIE